MSDEDARFMRDKDREARDAERQADLATLLWLAENDPAEAARRSGRVCPHCGEAMTPRVIPAPLPWDADHRRVQWPDRCGCPGEAETLADKKKTPAAREWEKPSDDDECETCPDVDDLEEVKRFWEQEDEPPPAPHKKAMEWIRRRLGSR